MMCDEDIFSQIDTKKMVEINMAETGSPEAPKEKKKRGRKPKAAAAAPPAPLAEEDFYVFQEDKAKKALAALEPKIAEWRGEAERTVVSSPESKEAALSFLLPLDKAAKDIEKARKALVEQPNSYVSRINFFAKCLKEKIGAAAGILNDKILAYDRDERLEREKRRKEAERLAKEEAERLAEAVKSAREEAENAAGEDIIIEPATMEIPPAIPFEPEPPKTVRTENGAATTVRTWSFKIVDLDKVPREFLMADEVKIRRAVRDGVRNIEGVDIFEIASLRLRS